MPNKEKSFRTWAAVTPAASARLSEKTRTKLRAFRRFNAFLYRDNLMIQLLLATAHTPLHTPASSQHPSDLTYIRRGNIYCELYHINTSKPRAQCVFVHIFCTTSPTKSIKPFPKRTYSERVIDTKRSAEEACFPDQPERGGIPRFAHFALPTGGLHERLDQHGSDGPLETPGRRHTDQSALTTLPRHSYPQNTDSAPCSCSLACVCIADVWDTPGQTAPASNP